MSRKDEKLMGKSREITILDRASKSRAYLQIHGFLTDGENKKVKTRIYKRQIKVSVAVDK